MAWDSDALLARPIRPGGAGDTSGGCGSEGSDARRFRSRVHPNTIRNLQQSRRIVAKHFGKNRKIAGIGVGDADAYREGIIASYSPVTVAREVKRARQFFKAAVRRGLIASNPFADVKGGSQVNSAKNFFVTRETAAAVLDACPDNEWRLIFSLSRFGDCAAR